MIKEIAHKLQCSQVEATKILEKARSGGEFGAEISEQDWFETRFLPNLVVINEDGYAKMCVDALKILGTTAATDYGSTRQRDLGQLWADMTRGYLGEFAFQLFLKEKFDIEIVLGHEIGKISDFLPSDIQGVLENDGELRSPKLSISIKTTKWNGIWLDIPGDQFNHSDVQVLVKVGTGRDHLFAFFKHLSVFKDKVLKKGQEVGAINSKEAEDIFEQLPQFTPITAYICGFVEKHERYLEPIYQGKKGRINYKIHSWAGKIGPGDIELIKKENSVVGKVEFEGIGTFAHDRGYLFNTGKLLWQSTDWERLIQKL